MPWEGTVPSAIVALPRLIPGVGYGEALLSGWNLCLGSGVARAADGDEAVSHSAGESHEDMRGGGGQYRGVGSGGRGPGLVRAADNIRR
jgi:hypothetical protein